jgi:Tol biopolymer transport system component
MISGEPTVARQSGRMVYVSGQYETKIFKMPLGAHGGSEPSPLVDAIGDHRDMSASQDGAHIAFTSNRTGSKEIWTANADGTKQTQLTFFQGPSVGSPRWSPDGKWIAFDGSASGSSDIYVIASEGGKPSRLTTDSGNEVRPSWSHDGKWIYYGWAHGRREIWKIAPSGGQPTRVIDHGYHAYESPDGQWLYVANPPAILRMRPDGSQETQVAGNVGDNNLWTIGGRSVYLLEPSNLDLMRAPFGSTAFEKVYHFDPSNRPASGGMAIAVPNDESYAIFRSVGRSVNTLMLIEGFR